VGAGRRPGYPDEQDGGAQVRHQARRLAP
jgi:hypothetical protein